MFYLSIFYFIYLTKHYIVDINRLTSHKQIVSWPHNKKWQKFKNINITWQACWKNSYHGRSPICLYSRKSSHSFTHDLFSSVHHK